MTVIFKDNGSRTLAFEKQRLEAYIDEVTDGFPDLDKEEYKEAVVSNVSYKDSYSADQITQLL